VLGRVYDENLQFYGAAWFDGLLVMLPSPSGFELNAATATSFDGTESIENGYVQGVEASVRWTAEDAESVSVELIEQEPVDVADVSGDGRWVIGTGASGMFRSSTEGASADLLPAIDEPNADCRVVATTGDGAVVVGNCSVYTGWFATRPFLWTEQGGTVTLDSVFDKLGVDASIYVSCSMVDIAADSSALILNCTRSDDAGAVQVGARLRLAGAFD